ncbi:hypothetical protein JTB14_027015 [Gonioctena quinquepunctata]|nr:hypothetical protein JTB14_027015 [Gonioctena quinquepunctata]
MRTTMAVPEGIQVLYTTTLAICSGSTTASGMGSIMSTAAGGMARNNSSTYSGGKRNIITGEFVIRGRRKDFISTETHPKRNLRRSPVLEGAWTMQYFSMLQSVGTHHDWTEA